MTRGEEAKGRYIGLWDELNALITEEITTYTLTPEKARRRFEDVLWEAFIEGWAAAVYMMEAERNARPPKDLTEKAAQKSYDGVSIYTKFSDYYEARDDAAIKDLVESEFHRAYNEGSFEGASRYGGKRKKWTAIIDAVTRQTHVLLDGTSLPLDGLFVSASGDTALYPGGFETAAENSHCRCWLEYTA